MKGTAAESNMSALDFSTTWGVVDRQVDGDREVSYPFLGDNRQVPEPGLETVSSLDDCFVIDAAGAYELGNDVSDTATCIEITASDVIFDGNNNTVQGVGLDEVDFSDPRQFGIEVNGTGTLSNVTVRNVTLDRWHHGLDLNDVSDVRIENVTAIDNFYSGIFVEAGSDVNVTGAEVVNTTSTDFTVSNAVTLLDSSNASVTDSALVDGNENGVTLSGVTTDTRVASVNASNNEKGIVLRREAQYNTVTGVTANDNTDNGIELSGANNTVTDSTFDDNGDGSFGAAGVEFVSVSTGDGSFQANNTVVENVTASGNAGDGFYLNRPTNVTLESVTATDNTNGVFLFRATGNRVLNSTVRNNAEWDIGEDGFETLVTTVESLDVGDSTAPNTTVSFEMENVQVRGVTSPPGNPSADSIGRYLEVTSEAGFGETDALRNFEIAYEDGDTADEANLTLWVEDSGWTLVDSTVDTANNLVTADLDAEIPDFGDATVGVFEFDDPLFEVNVTGTNSPVVEGDTLNVTVDVANIGNDRGTQEIDLFYDANSSGTATTLADSRTVELPPDGLANITLQWQTQAGDFADSVVIEVTSANATDTDTATVLKDAAFDVAVAAGSVNPAAIADALRAGLDDAGVLGDYLVETEQPVNVTGTNASAAADEYDVIVVNDFETSGGIEAATVPSSEVAALYAEADNDTRIVSLENAGTLSNAVTRRAETAVLDDPDQVLSESQGASPIRMNITGEHPLFKDVGTVNDTVDVYERDFGAQRAWFEGFDGEVVGTISNASTATFDGPGAGVTADGNEVLLSLGGLGTFQAQSTPAGERILANAVIFPFSPDLDVTITEISGATDESTVFVNGTVSETVGTLTEGLTVEAALADSNGTTVASATLAAGETDDAGNVLSDLEGNATDVALELGPPGPTAGEFGGLQAGAGDYTAILSANASNADRTSGQDQFRVFQGAPDCGNVTYTESGGAFAVGTLAGLQCMGDPATNSELDDDFVLTSDIDATPTAVWNNGSGFDPVGDDLDDGSAFNGTFDGQGHAITNLTVDRAGENGVGLFGEAGDATGANFADPWRVENVNLTGVDVTGGENSSDDFVGKVGGLVGNGFNGTLRNVFVSGTVDSPTGTPGPVDDGGIGGAVGLLNSVDTENAYAAVEVTASDGQGVGGFAGVVKSSDVTQAVATGNVTGQRYVGGLAGVVTTGGVVEESYATGSVTAVDGGSGSGTGGLAGLVDESTLRAAYATGDVESDGVDGFASGTGGVVGVIDESSFNGPSSVNETYAAGTVVPGATAGGGVVGAVDTDVGEPQESAINDSYWDELATGQTAAVGDGSAGPNVTGFATDDGQGRADEMTGVDASSNMSEFDFAGTWKTVTGPDDYPRLVPTFSVTIDAYTATVSEGETVSFEGTVFNVGEESDTQTVNLSEAVTGDGRTDDTGSITLAPGQQAGFNLSFDTQQGDAGSSGDVTVASDGDTEVRAVEVTGSQCGVVLDTPGEQFTLENDVQSDQTCIEITASNVHFDGNGFNVTGITETVPGAAGILVNGTAGTGGEISNVTVENVTVGNWDAGTGVSTATGVKHENVTGGQVTGVELVDNQFGLEIFDSANVTFAESTLTGGGLDIQRSPDVRVANNTFDESSLAIFGFDMPRFELIDNDIIDDTSEPVDIDSADDARIERNTIRGGFGAGISITGSAANVTVRDNVITEQDRGISLTGADDGTVVNNTVTGSSFGAGIQLSETAGATVARNNASNNSVEGIYLSFSDNNTVENNTATDNDGSHGIFLESSSNNTVRNNTALRNGLVDFFGDGIQLFDGSSNNLVVDNVVADNYNNGISMFASSSDNTVVNNVANGSTQFDGILAFNSDGAEIRDNVAVGNAAGGINLDNADGSLVVDNTARNNSGGIVVTGAFTGTPSVNNALIDNTVRENAEAGLVVENGSNATVETLDIGVSTAANTTISGEAENVSVGRVAGPPAAPGDRIGIGRYVDIESRGDGEFLSFELAYEAGDLPANINESRLGLWRFNGTAGEWSELADTGVDTERGVVTANITEFSTFGAFGAEADANLSVGEFASEFPDGVVGDDFGTVEIPVAETDGIETQNLTVTLEIDGEGNTFTLVATNDTELLQGGQQAFPFDVGVIDQADNYTATVTVEAANAATVVANETFVVAEQAPATGNLSALDIAGQGTDATITTGDNESVGVNVTNAGDQSGSFDVTLTLGPVNETVSTGTLAGGDTETVVFEGVTGSLEADQYTATVSTADDTVTGNLTVETPSTPSLDGLEVVNGNETSVIARGDQEDVAVNVTNVGEQAGSFDLTLTIGANVSVTASTGTLGPGEMERVVFEAVTGPLPISTTAYAVNVSAGDDLVSGSLRVHPDVTDNGLPARDTTDDGRLNDVDGDGQFDIFDVVALFNNYKSELLQQNVELFDFDGSDRIDIFDVQALFDQL